MTTARAHDKISAHNDDAEQRDGREGRVLPSGGAAASMAHAGLTSHEAGRLLLVHGPNELTRDRKPSALKAFAAQWKGAMVWLLLAATVVSAVLGEVADAVAIAVILLVNALIGFAQELRAERAVHALRRMTAPHARVARDGRVVDVPSRDVVPGDHLVLDAGDIVAADARLLEANGVLVNEAALTGESMPVEKRVGVDVGRDGPSTPLAERTGSIFAGTAIERGTGRAHVEKTGMATELGRIAGLLNATADEATPLQRRLEVVGRTLLFVCLGIVAVVAVAGLLRGMAPMELLLTSVSLAVAAVPEGLAAIVTIALAIGVKRMVTRNVLIRRLQAVETLGCATVICTDKTGTLTTGKMAVREVWPAERPIDRRRALEVATACCEATLDEGATAEARGTGDSTELALLAAARGEGIHRADVEAARPRVFTNPFDAGRKRMSVFRADGVLYVKGAVDLLLPLCRGGLDGHAAAVAANAAMASRGLRVLAVATGTTREERDLELVGLIGLADPPRPEAIAAVAAARGAGIRTVMITGDHPATAKAIALEMGIIAPGDASEEFVHARATPEQKLEIVRAWKSRGAVVAMTGDGVNDAPALKEAHIGVAMGKGGTEVTREAADMVLVDDNFASIVAAIKEGRGVFDNIRKVLVYLLGGNIAELVLVLVAILAGWPLPLAALQILWINLVTDGLPALALVSDRTDDDALKRPPRPTNEPMLGRREWLTIATTGIITSLCAIGVYAWALRAYGTAVAQSLVFFTIVVEQLVRAFAARSPTKTFFEMGAFRNLWLLAVVVLTGALQLLLHAVPLTRQLFSITSLNVAQLAVGVGVGLLPVTIIELSKLLRRAWSPPR